MCPFAHFVTRHPSSLNSNSAWISGVTLPVRYPLAAEPREVFKYAILSNAHGIILVHNHPSGSAEPSMEDRKFTGTMREAGKFLGIELIDHVIVGEANTCYSIRENEQWDK